MTASTKTKPASKSPNLDPAISREISVLRKTTADLPARITSDSEQQKIGALQDATHSLVKSIKSWYKKHTDPISAALKALRSEEKSLLEEPEAWLSRAQRLLSDYYLLKEAAAEKERLRLQKELDKEAEKARKAEISALKKNGDKDGAAALALAPIVAPIAEVENAASLEGKSFRDDVEVTVVDIREVPESFLKPRELALAEVKKAWKSGVTEIPGLSLKAKKTFVNG